MELPFVYPLSEINYSQPIRYRTGIRGFDHILGGGLVKGSTLILSGDRGIGKSTLLVQMANFIAETAQKKILYISGEENKEQIKLRAERLNINSDNVYLCEDTEVDNILNLQELHKPDVIIIDSLQMLYSNTIKQAQMTPTQMRHGILTLCKMAKKTQTTVIFVGHATKNGFIAGLQTLQHMVDVLIYLGRDEDLGVRYMKSDKNRFGESGFTWQIEMTATGIVDIGLLNQSENSNISNMKTLTLTDKSLDKLLEDNPVWRPIVKASFNFLKDKMENQK
jgi:DNA repair protein RadA/Sms